MHNATSGLCTVANGLDLRPGDEVLLTDQEHPSGRGCWYQKQARFGIRVREVPIPLPPKSADQLADVMISAIGPRTRVISFSGITTTSGLIMPIRRICDAARAKGVLSVVDGAHMNGQIPFRLSDLGCDFFAGSPHKWMFAPAGCGILYIREEMLDRLWCDVMSGNWNNHSLKAARFMIVGTNNRAIIEGMMAGLRFLKQLGPERVYARIHSLARLAYKMACDLPGARVLSSEDDRLYGGLVAFELKTPAWPAIHEVLKQKRVWHAAAEHTRLSTHIHTRPQDIEEFFSIVRDGLKRA
jgi:isopenicillin-N epimerase